MATASEAQAIASQLDGTLRSLFNEMVRSNSGLTVLQGELDRFTMGAVPGNKATAQLVALAFVRRQRLAVAGATRDAAEEFLERSMRGRIPEPKPPNNISAAVHIETGDPYKDWGDTVKRQSRIAPGLAAALEGAWATTSSVVGWKNFAETVQALRSLADGTFYTKFGNRFARDMAKTIVGYIADSGQNSMLGAVSRPTPLFLDTATDRSRDWAAQYSARLIKDITDEQRKTFRSQVSLAFEDGIGPEELAYRLKEHGLGLHNRYATAVDNYYRGMIEEGIARGAARERSKLYAGHLRRVRADTVARTETMYGLNWGRMELWNSAVQFEDLPSDTGKRWVTALDERVCPVCRPMNNVTVGLYQHFDLPQSALSRRQEGKLFLPPAHPSCRCTIILAHPDAREEAA